MLLIPVGSLNEMFRVLQDDALLDSLFHRAPHREAVTREGVLGNEGCYGYVPLLALGGSPASANLQRVDAYKRRAMNLELAGPPEVARFLFDSPEATRACLTGGCSRGSSSAARDLPGHHRHRMRGR